MSQGFDKLYASTRDKLRAKPHKQIATLQAESALVGGFESRVQVRDHAVTIDQPENFGGTNKGPKPGEYVLAALAACQEATYRLYADALGIPVDSVRVTVRATQDLRGFLNLDDSVSPGFQAIEGEVHLESSAPAEDLAYLKRMVDAHCPVLDDLQRPLSVSLSLAPASQAAE